MENLEPYPDLEHFKRLLNEDLLQKMNTEKYTDHIHFSTMIQAIQQQTTTAFNRAQRNILLEIVVTIPLFAGAYYLASYRGIHISPLIWTVFALITFGGHAYQLMKMQKTPPLEATDLLAALQARIQSLGFFLRMYNYSSGILAVCLFLALLFGRVLQLDSVILMIVYGVLSAFAALGFYIAARWYIQRIYGIHYHQLVDSAGTLQEHELQ